MRTKSSVSWLLLLPLLAALISLVPSPAYAQTFYGSIVGTVTDSSSAVVPGATVTVTDVGTNEKRTGLTGASGDYRFVNLLPATYKVEVEMAGFKHYLRTPITVQVDTAVRVDVALQVGAASETVEVSTAPPLLQTESGSLGETVEAKQVQEMPLNGRNTLNLLTLVPSVVPQSNTSGASVMNNGSGTSSGAWSNYSIGGGFPLQSGMYIDGAPIQTVQRNYAVVVPVQDVIQEFKVETSAVSAEFGRFGGGIVNMTTKSGSKSFHGTVYEYFRNNVLNANYFFSNRSGAARPQWNQNQYGGTVGGPIWKEKAFFFVGWEKIDIRTGVPQLTNIPTAALQSGVFNTDTKAPTDPLGNCTYAPYTGQTVNGQQFAPGGYYITNLWQGACGDPTAKILATFYPSTPNNLGNAADNWFKTQSEGDDAHQLNGRVDYNLSSRQVFFSRFTLWPSVDEAPVVVTPSNGWNTVGSQTHNHSNQIVAGDTYTFNPTTVLDFRADFVRNYGDAIPPSFVSGGVNESQFGSAYATLAPYMSYRFYPTFSFKGGTQLHNLYNFGYNTLTRQFYNNYHLSASLTKILGRHTLKIGGEQRELQRADVGADSASSGSFSFSADLGGDEWANFLMGDFDSGAITTIHVTFAHTYYTGLYINDTWQASPKLTLNMGLRYELPGALDDRHNSGTVLLPTTVDPATGITGTLGLLASSLYPHRTTIIPIHNAIGPRFGFAYRLSSNTVFRGGYSLSYLSDDQQPNALPYNSPVNSFTTTNSNSASNLKAGCTTTSPPTCYTLSNPFPATTQYPHGFGQAPGPTNPGFMTTLIGQSVSSPYPYEPYPHSQEMNVSIGHQMKGDVLIDVGVAHTLGTHLASISDGLDELPDQDDSLGSALAAKLTTPLAYDGINLPSSYQTYGQTLRPFPAYTNFINSSAFYATSSYNALEVKLQKRFRSAGQVGVSYTWSKSIGDADTISANQEGESGVAGVSGQGAYQDYNNLKAERSIYSFNVPNRLVINYILNLPFGQGQRFATGVHGVAGKAISGWSLDGITILQSGYPLYLDTSGNQLSKFFGAGTIRPNYTAGCSKTVKGSGFARAQPGATWFNTSCFTAPTTGSLSAANSYAFGNEPRVDGTLKDSGVDNFDFSVQKSTPLHEQVALLFRVEIFNAFNRVQFGDPVVQADNSQFGQILAQYNKPRLIQGALRINF